MRNKPLTFDDLYPPSTPVQKQIGRLEALRDRLVSQCNFWLWFRARTRKRALEASGVTEAGAMEAMPEWLNEKTPAEVRTLAGAATGREKRPTAEDSTGNGEGGNRTC